VLFDALIFPITTAITIAGIALNIDGNYAFLLFAAAAAVALDSSSAATAALHRFTSRAQVCITEVCRRGSGRAGRAGSVARSGAGGAAMLI
jgi:hypothetical protein